MSWLAGQPGDDCFDENHLVGHGNLKGRGVIQIVGGLQTYVTSPSALGDRILLFFSDVHGPFHINNQVLMDYFASKGYLVFSPDYFEGQPVQIAKLNRDFDQASWIQSSFARAKMLCPPWVHELRKQFEETESKIGAVGYCFGAPFVLDLCRTDHIISGAIVHPAFVAEEGFQNIRQPLLLSCAEIDNTFTSETRHRSEEILKEARACYHFELYSGVRHGFALRGTLQNAWARRHCAESIISWMDRFMLEPFVTKDNSIDEIWIVQSLI